MNKEREFANDLECLVFSDIVYEDFEDGDEGTLIDIFSDSQRFHNEMRQKRFEEYKRNVATLDQWEFIMQSGENELEEPEPSKSESDNVVVEIFKDMFSNLYSDQGLRKSLKWVGQNIDSIKELTSRTVVC